MNNQVSHEDFMKIINEERSYRVLKKVLELKKVKKIKKQTLIDLLNTKQCHLIV